MTEKIIIRQAVKHDWKQIIEIYNYYIINTPYTFDYDIHTIQTRLSWFEQFQTSSVYQLLVAINEKNQVVAYAATTPFGQNAGYHTSASISIYCHPHCTQSGLGSRLLEVIIEQCKSTKIHNIYAGITVSNDASVQLFRKFNFTEVAHFSEVGYKFNQFWDVIWYEKKLNRNPND